MNCNKLLKKLYKNLMKIQFFTRHKTCMHNLLTQSSPTRQGLIFINMMDWVELKISQPDKIGLSSKNPST